MAKINAATVRMAASANAPQASKLGGVGVVGLTAVSPGGVA